MDLPVADHDSPALDWSHPDIDWSRPDAGWSQEEIDSNAASILDAAGIATGDAEEMLSDTQRAMLDFERIWWRAPGAKDQAIRERFGMSPLRYYQALNQLLDSPQALRYDAVLVKRLNRLRSAAGSRRAIRD